MEDLTEIRERLLKEDGHFRHLTEEHRGFEEKLEALQVRRWLSDQEQIEEVRLKKMKLSLKDEMESILKQGVAQ